MDGFGGGGLGAAGEVGAGFLGGRGEGWYGLVHEGAGLKMVGEGLQ